MSHTAEPHCRPGLRLHRRWLGLASLGTVAVGLLLFNAWHPGVASAPARLQIENSGHVAGEPVTITGSGFAVNESVSLTVRHDDGSAEPLMGHQAWTVIAADGTFSTTWTVNAADAGSHFFEVTAVGTLSAASGTARFGRMAVVATDKFDYGPGETAQILGSGFRAGETVTLQVTHTNPTEIDGAGHNPWTVTADSYGRISAGWYVDPDDSLGASFIVKARGEDSHLRARWAFIDAVCPPAPPPDVVAPFLMPGQTCPGNLNSCTANDVVTSVVAAIPVNGDVCGSADDTLTLDFTVQFATTANQRYDLGFYISKDGLAIPGGAAQVCAGAAPQVGDGDKNADTSDCDTDLFLDLDHDGHLPNRDAVDTCGDLENNAGPVRMTFRATVACDHLDADHNLLVPSCRVWEQNANHQVACTTLSQAGTGSKCDCTDLSFAGVLDPCVTAYCDDSNACTADSCVNVNGDAVCQHDDVPDQTTCDDGSACTTGDVCIAGTCTGGAPPNCDDGNACTSDGCTDADGCYHTPNANSCDDGIFCNGADVCAGGNCTHGGDPCTGDQTCNEDPGECVGCNDNDDCLADQVCDPVDHTCGECNVDGDCDEGQVCNTGNNTCVQCVDNGDCNDDTVCNGTATCTNNVCVPVPAENCDDGNGCTDDSCDPVAGCQHTNNTAPCDDGMFCDGVDVCAGGECTHSGGNGGCVDDCHIDSDCDPGQFCFPENHTCVQCLVNDDCNDDTVCNGTATCTNNVCVPVPAENCDDGNGCTDDSCDPVAGCQHTNNTAPCDDGVFCNGADVCAGGTCTHGGDACAADQNCNEDGPIGGKCVDCNHNGDCDPGKVCKSGGHTCVECNGDEDCDGGQVCNPENNTCVECVNDGDCNDDTVCNGTATCANYVCVPVPAENCDDGNGCTDDSCDPVAGCQHTNNTAPCDDGVFCNGADVCAGGTCTHGGDACAADQNCNEDGPIGGKCVDCNHNGDCDPGKVCKSGGHTCVDCNGDEDCDGGQVCNPGNNTCVQCLTDAQCNDGNACNGVETCVANACQDNADLNCNDGNGCTDDLCNPTSGCYHTNNTSSCNDGNACTTGDTCGGGSCNGGAPPNCNDGNVCTNDLCNPASGCYHTGNTNSCDDGNACTTGDVCGSGSCHGGAPPNCNDNNPCTSDSCNTATGCTHTTTGDGQNGSCESVTDTEFCPLPPDNTCGAGTFRLIDLQNPTIGAGGGVVQNDYLLNASNPGQWYYNVFYSGAPGAAFNLTIDIPWPFITNGANPIQVHNGTSFSGACFVPNPALTGFVITTDAGHVSTSGNAVVLLADYKMQNLGDTQAVYVSGTVPASGLAYVTVHLDYGIKKVSGWQQNVTTLQGPDVDLNGTLDGLGDGPIFIKGGTPACTNGQDYRFDFSGGGPTLGTTIFSTNTFKKNPGVNGMITKTNGSPKTNLRVEFYGPNNKLISALNTDTDGFYMFTYKHTGKAATYTVKVPSLGLQRSVTLKANGYALLNFENAP